jgi:putative SOS response-associated peptidase YedK
MSIKKQIDRLAEVSPPAYSATINTEIMSVADLKALADSHTRMLAALQRAAQYTWVEPSTAEEVEAAIVEAEKI